MLFDFFIIAIGFFLLVKGADFLIKGSAIIAKKFGLSEMIIGLTIVSIGTSLPEIFITIKSALQGHSELIIGNAIGSSICNFLFVIGISSIFRPIKVDKRINKIHIPIGIGAMLLVMLLADINLFSGSNTLARWQGIVLIIFTLLYILYTIYEEKNNINKKGNNDKVDIIDNDKEKNTHAWKIALYIILGCVMLKIGSDFVVDHAIHIAESFNLTQRVISMTIIAIGTALPEIVTSIIASLKGESDLILGNMAGSNILNLCLLIGLGAIISPMPFSKDFNASILLLIVVTIIINVISTMDKEKSINRSKGIILILIYVLYILNLFRV